MFSVIVEHFESKFKTFLCSQYKPILKRKVAFKFMCLCKIPEAGLL